MTLFITLILASLRRIGVLDKAWYLFDKRLQYIGLEITYYKQGVSQ